MCDALQIVILKYVSHLNWQKTVASLFTEAGRALAAGQANQARIALGTSVAYLEIAQKSGDAVAADLLRQLVASSSPEHTERFSFAPGELEQLEAGNRRAAGY